MTHETLIRRLQISCLGLDAIDPLRLLVDDVLAALAQPEQEPVGKLQEPAAERAWFTIAELNAWADKKLSENPHWVMPKDEPERKEALAQTQEPVVCCQQYDTCLQPCTPRGEHLARRTWVGLTDDERSELVTLHHGWNEYGQAIENKLKEKNT